MGVAEKKPKMVARGYWDGEKVVLPEPLQAPRNAQVEVRVIEERPTWVAKRFGVPSLSLRGEGPTIAEIICEERGPY